MVLKGRDYGFIGLKLKGLIFHESADKPSTGTFSTKLVQRNAATEMRWLAANIEYKEDMQGEARVKGFAALQPLQSKASQCYGFLNACGLFTYAAHADTQKSVAF